MTSTEPDFISKFLTLATLNEPALSSNYEKPLQEISSIGVQLPPLKYRYDPTKVKREATPGILNTSSSTPIPLTLKSVRPPKFSLEHQFSSNDTIYQVKKYLVDESKAQSTTDLKLLLKGKVLHDSVPLVDLEVENPMINVMISKSSSATTSPAPIPVPKKAEKPLEKEESLHPKPLMSLPWEDIESLLETKLQDKEHATQALQRLKRGWSLTE
ncbi:hypothetical protein NCAS_0C04710 [Naumovozyma castellii]|uniref:Ubiquitin-like domain-containing protein n=1 Tax=Naumovozyma castellii TaxID=27288 RepID=G0VD99_NAUCA|nr:hypothetical protein NCAS_0C04710 [Naumovozyma castellii CBS 4309]CCC69461.1 hypothetical protein NCAS_0C04710 [Naumovozyma castellii CBS 4309]